MDKLIAKLASDNADLSVEYGVLLNNTKKTKAFNDEFIKVYAARIKHQKTAKAILEDLQKLEREMDAYKRM
jgi:hypothetical protein